MWMKGNRAAGAQGSQNEYKDNPVSGRGRNMQYFVWGLDGLDSKAQRIAIMERHWEFIDL